MVTTLEAQNETHVEWTSPAPLWTTFQATASSEQRAIFRTPAILQFNSDTFMQQFVDLMQNRPEDLENYLAVAETWRQPAPETTPIARKSAFRARLDRIRAAAIARGEAMGKELVRSQPWNVPQVKDVPKSRQKPLKLYQPAHERYYMVTACLVCRTLGLPDRAVQTNAQERATFVVRMLDTSVDPNTFDPKPRNGGGEYALVGDQWVSVGTNSLQLVDGEEQYPLSPMSYSMLDGRKRRIFNGLIPASQREKLVGARMPRVTPPRKATALTATKSTTGSAPTIDKDLTPSSAPAGAPLTIRGTGLKDATSVSVAGIAADFAAVSGDDTKLIANVPEVSEQTSGPISVVTPGGTVTTSWSFTIKTEPVDTRLMMLKMDVLAPWANIDAVAAAAYNKNDNATNIQGQDTSKYDKTDSFRAANEQIQMVSWYVLLDFAHWIQDNISGLWTVLQGPAPAPGNEYREAYNALESLSDHDNARTLRAALIAIGTSTAEKQLELAKRLYPTATDDGWPSLKFQFVHASATGSQGLWKDGAPAKGEDIRPWLETVFARALPEKVKSTIPPRSIAEVSSNVYATRWFVVRCVFERPNCAPMVSAVVSDATASFQLASFFDSDAPARKIRIAMPADTTPAGLRKFDKNTAFVLSDVLCGQVGAIRDLTFADLVLSVLPWPFHQDLKLGSMKPCPAEGPGEMGMVCSMSIPIITICALILLMIMVKLLDIIFYWLPFFFICLPVPKFDAKFEVKKVF